MDEPSHPEPNDPEVSHAEVSHAELDHPELDHPEAGPTPPYQRDQGIRRLEAIEAELVDVERAVARLEEGTYGRCAVCQDALPDALLAERPTAEVCAAHLDVITH